MAIVEWQTTCTNIKQRGVYLLQTEEWSDCELLVGPEETRFRAHKLILTMASPIFESIFYGDSKETDTYKIPDVEPDAFKALLDYIYTENISIDTFTAAYNIYMVANKYMIQQLARVCAEFIGSSIQMETACQAYEVGYRFQDDVLMNDSLQIIKMHIKEIVNHKSFFEAEVDTVAKIFSIEGLQMEEMELFEALEKYAQAHATRKRRAAADQSGEGNHLRKALQQIRFLSLTLEEFANGPAKSGLLTQGEALALMLNIVGAEAPMPAGFSTRRSVRFVRPSPSLPPSPPSPSRCALTLRCVLPLAVSVRSPPSEACSRPWSLAVLPVTATTTSGYSKDLYYGIYLKCERTESAPWACIAKVEFIAVAAKPGVPNHTKTVEYKFTSLQNVWGEDKFLRMISDQYTNNGVITFRANVEVSQPVAERSAPSSSTQP